MHANLCVSLDGSHSCLLFPTRGCRSCHSGWVQVQSQRPRATSTSPRNTFLPRGSACHTDRFKVRLRSSPILTLYWRMKIRMRQPTYIYGDICSVEKMVCPLSISYKKKTYNLIIYHILKTGEISDCSAAGHVAMSSRTNGRWRISMKTATLCNM